MATSNGKKGAAKAAPTLDELAAEIRALNEKADQTRLENAIEVGVLLLAAKPRVPRGQWEVWVKETLRMPRVRSARNMRFASNVQALVHCKTVEEADVLLRRPSKPKPQPSEPKRKTRESGKRLHRLHALKREQDSNLLIARRDIVKMVGIVEAVDLPALGFGDADQETIAEIHAELCLLFDWLDRTLKVVTTELSSLKLTEKIRRLREDTAGRTPEEIDTARKLADKLERKQLQAA
jgi:hypothetical protein